MLKNLDLEIKKALNEKLELDDFILFIIKANNQMVIKATYDQEPECIQHTHKNVTITYYTWNDGLSEEVTNEITIHYETQRAINKTDKLEPIVKEMVQEIINAKTKHMPN